MSKRSRKEKEMSAVEKTRSVVKNASSHARQKLTISGRDKANSQRPTRVTIAIIKVKVFFSRVARASSTRLVNLWPSVHTSYTLSSESRSRRRSNDGDWTGDRPAQTTVPRAHVNQTQWSQNRSASIREQSLFIVLWRKTLFSFWRLISQMSSFPGDKNLQKPRRESAARRTNNPNIIGWEATETICCSRQYHGRWKLKGWLAL